MFTAYAEIAIDLVVNIAAIFLLAYVLYFRRHRRADLLLAYVALNIGIFVAISLLTTVRVDIALGFGLFAILSIIRLRSSSVTQQEVAYYFVALVMGLVNGMDIPDRRLVVMINVLLLGAMAIVDSKPLRERTRRMDVHLDVVHSDDASLVADLERRLGGTVLHHEVNDVDYVRQTMLVDVRYRAGTHPRRWRPWTSGSWTSRWTWSTPTTRRWSPTSSAGSAGRCCATASRTSTTCATPWRSRCATASGRRSHPHLDGHRINGHDVTGRGYDEQNAAVTVMSTLTLVPPVESSPIRDGRSGRRPGPGPRRAPPSRPSPQPPRWSTRSGWTS